MTLPSSMLVHEEYFNIYDFYLFADRFYLYIEII